MVQEVISILIHQMIKHGFFLLIIKRNSKLNLEDHQVQLLMGIILIIYYRHLEVPGIYVLMKTDTKIQVIIQFLEALMNYHQVYLLVNKLIYI